MPRKKKEQAIHQRRKESLEKYRKKVLRFTLKFSLADAEAREWFEQQEDKGLYLKYLILQDKARTLEELAVSHEQADTLSEKPSIRAQLAAAKTEQRDKPAAKTKNHDQEAR